ncbi:MAG: hypothetical protein JW937_10295 [Candidatus Omnitrophica bacterium]|nr:hypothetical protein [Candidatus Omnitrophota bacterium]
MIRGIRRFGAMGLALIVCVGIAACGQKAESSAAAIDHAKTLGTVEAQAQYLVKQGQAFLNSKQYEEAMQTVKYVLSNVDKSSQEAQKILQQAKDEMAAAAQKAAADLKGSLGGK